MWRPHMFCNSDPSPPLSDILIIKHDSRILWQSSNPVCGFSMMEQASLCAVWPELAWLFREPHTGLESCLRILLACFRIRMSALCLQNLCSVCPHIWGIVCPPPWKSYMEAPLAKSILPRQPANARYWLILNSFSSSFLWMPRRSEWIKPNGILIVYNQPRFLFGSYVFLSMPPIS